MRLGIQSILLAAAAVVGASVWAGSAASVAQAQNALGRGDALDANLRVGDRRNPRTRDLRSEVRFRNALVTGNAPGGFSFRGDVGYSSPDDFRGATGSDDIFAFTRDSVFSALGARGVPSFDPLQMQMGLSTLPVISRPSAGFSANELRATPEDARLGELSINPVQLRPRSLRSTTEFISDLSLDPSIVSMGRTEEDETLYTVASPLRGVVMQPTPDYPSVLGERTAEDEEDAERPFDRPGRLTERIEPGREELRESLRVEPDRMVYEELLEQLRTMDAERRAQEQEEADREQAEEDAAAPGLPQAPDGLIETPAPIEDELQRLRDWLRLPTGETEREVAPAEAPEPPSLDRTIELIEQFSPEVETLTPPVAPSRNLYAEHMNRGQQMLDRGRWFDAEERFTSALMMRPDDPLAAAGRVHAQIGAGMFLSAAVNLEQLLREHPELIGAQYDASLLPSSERLASVRDTLRRRISEPGRRGRHAALLLAYLGHQVGDDKDVADAFEAIGAAGEGDEAGPFIEILRRVWLTPGR